MSAKYPGAWAYLSAFKKQLLPRQLDPSSKRDVPCATWDTWYQFGRDQNITLFFNTPKIIVKNMFKENPLFAYDDDNLVIASGGTAGYSGLIMREGIKLDIRFFQAYLNCEINLKVLRMIGSDFEGGFTSIGTNVLKKLYVPEIDLSDSLQKGIYDAVLNDLDRLRDLNLAILTNSDDLYVRQLLDEKSRIVSEMHARFEGLL